MKLPVLLISLLIATTLVGFLVLRGGDDDRDAPSPEVIPATEAAGEQESLPDALDPSPGRSNAAEEQGGAESVTTNGATNPAPDVPDAQALLAQRDLELLVQSFEDRHGHRTPDELRVALAQVEEAIQEQQKIFFTERFDRGTYDVQVMGAPPLSPPEPDSRGRLPLRDGRTTTDPQTMRMEAHIVTLPFDEYPELYELIDERDWLQQRIGD